MRIILSGRQTGRSTKLIELCYVAEQSGRTSYIVCHTQEEAYRLAQEAREMDKPIPFPISFEEFLHRRFAGQRIDSFFIDNADLLLRYLAHPVNIEAIVVTGEIRTI